MTTAVQDTARNTGNDRCMSMKSGEHTTQLQKLRHSNLGSYLAVISEKRKNG